MCNVTSQSFCRLFLDTVHLKEEDDDTDDDTDETENDNDDNDDCSECSWNVKVTTSANDKTIQDKARLYRRRAHSLKQKVKLLQELNTNKSHQHQKLLDQTRELQATITQITERSVTMKETLEAHQRMAEQTHLDLARVTRERGRLQLQLQQAKQATAKLEHDLRQCRKQLHQEMERSQLKAIREVESITIESRRLLDENRQLKERTNQQKKHLDMLQDCLRQDQRESASASTLAAANQWNVAFHDTTAASLARTLAQQQSRAAHTVKQVSLEASRQAAEQSRPAKRKREASNQTQPGSNHYRNSKVSQNAARLGRASRMASLSSSSTTTRTTSSSGSAQHQAAPSSVWAMILSQPVPKSARSRPTTSLVSRARARS